MDFKLFPLKIKLSSRTLITITIFYMVVIYFLTISEKVGFPGETGRLINNVAHVPIFFILTTLYLICFNSLNLFSFKLSYLCSLFLAIIFSLLTEYLQSHISYRTASLMDTFFNFIGIILAMTFYKKLFCQFPNNLTKVNPNK